MDKDVFPEEKRDPLDVSDLPLTTCFGGTLADAEAYGRKLEHGNVPRYNNATIRDVTKETFLDFMGRPLQADDEAEIDMAMKAVAEMFN